MSPHSQAADMQWNWKTRDTELTVRADLTAGMLHWTATDRPKPGQHYHEIAGGGRQQTLASFLAEGPAMRCTPRVRSAIAHVVEPAHTVRRIVEEVFNADRFERIDELIAQDYTDHAALPGQPAGRATVRDTAERYRTAFPDLRWTIDELLVAGTHKVVLRWSAAGTHRGPFGELAATGRSVRFAGMSLYALRRGRQVTDEWVYWDELGLLRSLTPCGRVSGRDAP